MKRDYPLTSDDLRYLAGRIDEITAVVGSADLLPDDDWRWGLSVKVWNQDASDQDDIAGVIAPHGDGWLGFYPNEIKPVS